MRGLQTPKLFQLITLLIPLHFWFCNHIDQVLPLISLPYGRRFIEITLEKLNNIVYEVPYIYVQNLNNEVKPYFKSGVISSHIKSLCLYINNIFLDTEVLNIIFSKLQVHLVRIMKTQTQEIGDVPLCWLSWINWPVEYLIFGFRPLWNNNKNNPNKKQDWHSFTKNIYQYNNKDEYCIKLPIVQYLRFISSDVVFHRNYNTFFESVMNKNQIRESEEGVMVVDFRHIPIKPLYTDVEFPSGNLNFARAKDFHIEWQSDFINKDHKAELVVLARCLNLLWIKNGQFVLNYTNI